MHRTSSRPSPLGYAAAAVVFAFAVLASATAPGMAAVRTPTSAKVRVKNIKVGSESVQVVVDPRTRTAWVAAGHLVRISEVTRRVSARINVGPSVDFVAVDPRRHAVWTTCSYGLCPLTEVSERTNRVTNQVSGIGTVSGIAVDPRTRLVWIATTDATHHNVALAVSEVTSRVVRTIRLRFGAGHVAGAITADPRTRTVWVSGVPCGFCSARDVVAEISEPARRVVHLYRTATRGISTSVVTAVDSRRGTAWLSSGAIREPSGTIQVVRIAKHRIIRTIRTSWVAPEGIAIDSRTRMVVATGGAGSANRYSVILLNESSGAQTGRLFTGFYPNLLAIDQGTGNAYVPIIFRKVVAQFHL